MKYFINHNFSIENEQMEFIDFLFQNDFIDCYLYNFIKEVQNIYRNQKEIKITMNYNNNSINNTFNNTKEIEIINSITTKNKYNNIINNVDNVDNVELIEKYICQHCTIGWVVDNVKNYCNLIIKLKYILYKLFIKIENKTKKEKYQLNTDLIIEAVKSFLDYEKNINVVAKKTKLSINTIKSFINYKYNFNWHTLWLLKTYYNIK